MAMWERGGGVAVVPGACLGVYRIRALAGHCLSWLTPIPLTGVRSWDYWAFVQRCHPHSSESKPQPEPKT